MDPLVVCPDASVTPTLAAHGEAGDETLGSTAAIANLEALRAEGASRLVLPPEAGTWLAERPGFRVHVEACYPRVPGEEVRAMHSLEPGGWRSPERALEEFLELYRWRYRKDPSILDWTRTMRVRPRTTDPPMRDDRPLAPARKTVIFGPAGSVEELPNSDDSVTIVVVGGGPSPETLTEARRVARTAVVIWPQESAGAQPLSAVWLRDAKAHARAVSIVIARGQDGGDLDTCLRWLAENTIHDGAAIEVIVSDDSSGDAVNRAADAADGEVLVFLSDDVLALPGWLHPLFRTLRDEPDVGVVGGRLLSRNGRVHGEGAADPDAPPRGSVREVDFVPDVLLATRADLFRTLGGLDGEYCTRARGAGCRVLYHPQSAVVSRQRSRVSSQAR